MHAVVSAQVVRVRNVKKMHVCTSSTSLYCTCVYTGKHMCLATDGTPGWRGHTFSFTPWRFVTAPTKRRRLGTGWRVGSPVRTSVDMVRRQGLHECVRDRHWRAITVRTVCGLLSSVASLPPATVFKSGSIPRGLVWLAQSPGSSFATATECHRFDASRNLPIHLAAINNAPVEVMRLLLRLAPDTASVVNCARHLPLHLWSVPVLHLRRHW